MLYVEPADADDGVHGIELRQEKNATIEFMSTTTLAGTGDGLGDGDGLGLGLGDGDGLGVGLGVTSGLGDSIGDGLGDSLAIATLPGLLVCPPPPIAIATPATSR